MVSGFVLGTCGEFRRKTTKGTRFFHIRASRKNLLIRTVQQHENWSDRNYLSIYLCILLHMKGMKINT